MHVSFAFSNEVENLFEELLEILTFFISDHSWNKTKNYKKKVSDEIPSLSLGGLYVKIGAIILHFHLKIEKKNCKINKCTS